jgi:hypothetical protein
VAAAAEGRQGQPGAYRDYKLRQIMQEQMPAKVSNEICAEREGEVVLR